MPCGYSVRYRRRDRESPVILAPDRINLLHELSRCGPLAAPLVRAAGHDLTPRVSVIYTGPQHTTQHVAIHVRGSQCLVVGGGLAEYHADEQCAV